MHEKQLGMPDIMMIAGTRVALGAGIGLLVASVLGQGVRKGAGWSLLSLGVLTTIPLVLKARSGMRGMHDEQSPLSRVGVEPAV